MKFEFETCFDIDSKVFAVHRDAHCRDGIYGFTYSGPYEVRGFEIHASEQRAWILYSLEDGLLYREGDLFGTRYYAERVAKQRDDELRAEEQK